MNLIIPMAGLGKRLRPHTLTTAKPLLPIAGKPIVHRLVEDIARISPEKIKHVGFIIHPSFGKQVEEDLLRVAKENGAVGHIYYQEQAQGISHALLFAKELFEGNVIVAFADTLFRATFTLDVSRDGIIWVQQVKDPSQFGVVTLNDQGVITAFVEKPAMPVSNLAIIGIYFFRNGAALRDEMQHLLDNDIREKGEYQLTTALENMRRKGARFITGEVSEWLDCGNKDNMVDTNARYLSYLPASQLRGVDAVLENVKIIEPVYLGKHVTIRNSTIGPAVSIGDHTTIESSIVSNSIVQTHCKLLNARLSNSMLGNHVNFQSESSDASLGDFSTLIGPANKA